MYDGYVQGDTCESSVEFKKCLKHFPFQVKAFAFLTDLSWRGIIIIKVKLWKKNNWSTWGPNWMQWAPVKFDAGIDGGEGERPWGTRLKRTLGTSKCRSCNCEWSSALVNPCRINWVWQAARTSQILDTGMTLSYPSTPSLFAFDLSSKSQKITLTQTVCAALQAGLHILKRETLIQRLWFVLDNTMT